MDIGLVGDGPAVDAVSTALGDVDVNVMPVEPGAYCTITGMSTASPTATRWS